MTKSIKMVVLAAMMTGAVASVEADDFNLNRLDLRQLVGELKTQSPSDAAPAIAERALSKTVQDVGSKVTQHIYFGYRLVAIGHGFERVCRNMMGGQGYNGIDYVKAKDILVKSKSGQCDDLEAAWLDGADLSGADLGGAKLSFAHLNGTDLRGADLRAARLDGASADHSKLDGAALQQANLSGADLRWATLRKAELGGASLHGASLQGADLSGAVLQNAELAGADLTGANLAGADLRGAAYNNITRLPFSEAEATQRGMQAEVAIVP